MYCRDFFKEEIEAELEQARVQGISNTEFWYTRTFGGFAAKDWICPNTTSIELNGRYAQGLKMEIVSCLAGQALDKDNNLTSYADQDGK